MRNRFPTFRRLYPFSVSVSTIMWRPFLNRLTTRSSFVQELRAGDNRVDHGAKSVIIGRQLPPHVFNETVIRWQQRPAQREGEQFAAQVIDKLVLALTTEIRAQAFQANPLRTAREGGVIVHGPIAQVLGAAFADWPIAFENKADAVKAFVTARRSFCPRDGWPTLLAELLHRAWPHPPAIREPWRAAPGSFRRARVEPPNNRV